VALVGKTERRQSILAHARDVFARKGYHEAKIEDIVQAAGVARGTFYLYFDDKRAVFEEIVDRAFAQIGMAIVRVDPNDRARTVEEQVRENLRRIVEVLLEDRATTRILLSDAMGVDPAFDRKLRAFYEVAEKLLVESLQDGQKLGLIANGDPRMLAYFTMGALKEILFQVVKRDAPYEKERIESALFEFLRRGCLRVGE
jgi:AcrR family transcriptional regulator